MNISYIFIGLRTSIFLSLFELKYQATDYFQPEKKLLIVNNVDLSLLLDHFKQFKIVLNCNFNFRKFLYFILV